MKNLVVSYNGNSANEYLILPRDDTPGALVKGFEGVIIYLFSYLTPVSLEFDTTLGQDKFTDGQKIALEKVAEAHNKLKGIEAALKD